MEHKLGIIGFGVMAELHYNTVRRSDINIQPVAVYDVREVRREKAESLGMKAYDNIDDFFADGRFDLVLVATSNNHHARYTCMAMERGFDVICEKPAAMNAAEVEKMIEVSEKTGRFFTIHQNRRFDADFRKVKKALEDKAVGNPYLIESRIMTANGSGCMFNWRGMTDHGGGMLPDWGVHMLDQMLWLNKERTLESVYAVIKTVASEEVDDYSKLILQYADGLTCQIEVATYSPVVLPRWFIHGDEGGAMMQSSEDATLKVRRIKEQHIKPMDAPAYDSDYDYTIRPQKIRIIDTFEESEVTNEGINADWGSIYKNILAVMEGSEELIVKPEEVLLCMKVIDAAYQSAKTGEVVRMN